MKIETVPSDRVIWQTDKAKTYLCPFCGRSIFSQHEGDDLPRVQCEGPMQPHVLEWGGR